MSYLVLSLPMVLYSHNFLKINLNNIISHLDIDNIDITTNKNNEDGEILITITSKSLIKICSK